MTNTRTALTVAIALVTIVGMTVIFGGAAGAAFSSADSSDSLADGNSITLDTPGDDESDGTDENASDAPDDNASDAPDDNASDDESSNGSSDEPHGEDDEKEEKDDDDDSYGDNGDNETNGDNGEDGTNGDNATNGDDGEDGTNGDDGDVGTCEESGLVQENTIANEAFDTENEEGPISSELHENEEEFEDVYVIVHEGSCLVATVDNEAADDEDNGDDGDDHEFPE